MSWHINGASETAKQIKSDITAAIKDGRLPAGTKVSARKDTGSMMTAVNVQVTTPEPERYKIRGEGFTQAGRQVVDVLHTITAPHLHKVDGVMSFLDVSLNGGGIGTPTPAAVEAAAPTSSTATERRHAVEDVPEAEPTSGPQQPQEEPATAPVSPHLYVVRPGAGSAAEELGADAAQHHQASPAAEPAPPQAAAVPVLVEQLIAVRRLADTLDVPWEELLAQATQHYDRR